MSRDLAAWEKIISGSKEETYEGSIVKDPTLTFLYGLNCFSMNHCYNVSYYFCDFATATAIAQKHKSFGLQTCLITPVANDLFTAAHARSPQS